MTQPASPLVLCTYRRPNAPGCAVPLSRQADRVSDRRADSVPMRDKSYTLLLHSDQRGLTGSKMETRVSLRPGEKGTKVLVQQHENRPFACATATMPRAARATRG